MKRILLCIASLLVLGVVAGAVQAQEPYTPTTQQSAQAPTTEQSPPAADPATSDPSMSGSSELPATASPWPLVGLVGFASLAAGLYLPRRRAKS